MDLHVGSIPFKWKDADLMELFEQYGEVISASIIMDKITRQNKGFGFVSMPNESEATQAIHALNNSEHEGRAITVSLSQPKGQIRKPFRTSNKKKETPQKTTDWKSDKHKKSVPPWMRKEY